MSLHFYTRSTAALDTITTFAVLQKHCCIELNPGLCDLRQRLKPGEVIAEVPKCRTSGNPLAVLLAGAQMATPALNSQVQSLVAEYSVFWQSWPQFEQIHGERRLVGFEVELIGFHTSDLNHLDPGCPACRHVRSVLLAIVDAMPRETSFRRNYLTYNIDSHSNSILCLPALGNRSAVSVSIYVFWNRSNGQSFETDPLSDIKAFLNGWGIHQR